MGNTTPPLLIRPCVCSISSTTCFKPSMLESPSSSRLYVFISSCKVLLSFDKASKSLMSSICRALSAWISTSLSYSLAAPSCPSEPNNSSSSRIRASTSPFLALMPANSRFWPHTCSRSSLVFLMACSTSAWSRRIRVSISCTFRLYQWFISDRCEFMISSYSFLTSFMTSASSDLKY